MPARDEAAILPVTLPALLAQDYPGPFSVTLVDDSSSDGTGAVAAALAAGAPRALRVVPGAAPPPGWAGKPWAMAQGLAAAGAGGAPYILFTDADIAWQQPGALRALVAAAEASDRDLVSQMVLLRTETGWEKAIIPAFVYFFAQLYPFRWVNRPGGRTAAAAGGCMLVRRHALETAGGLAPIRGALIDDVALGRLLKRPPARGRCWLGLTTSVRSVRPYTGSRTCGTWWRGRPTPSSGTRRGCWPARSPAWPGSTRCPRSVRSRALTALAGSAGRIGAGPLLCAAAGAGRLGGDGGQLPADAAAVPAVAAAGPDAARDRAHVRGHDRRLGPAALRRPGRRLERPGGAARRARKQHSGKGTRIARKDNARPCPKVAAAER